MSANLAPIVNAQFLNLQGIVLAGGKISTYLAGTTTPAPTYTDSTQQTQNANPIVLNAAGLPPNEIWIPAGTQYKFVITDASNNPIVTYDNISGINDVSSTASQWTPIGATPTYVSSNSFTVSGNLTGTFANLRRIQATVSAGTVYGYVQKSSFASNVTTVTVFLDSGSLDAGLSSVNVGFLNSTNPAVPQQFEPFINVLDPRWGIVADGASSSPTDNQAGLAALQSYLASLTYQPIVLWPSGVYSYSVSPNWARDHARHIAMGEVRLRYTGTGNAVILDAGSGSQNVVDVTFGNPGNPFIIEVANSTGAHACFVRSIHHSTIAIKPRSAGANSAGLAINFAVCTRFYVTCSVNEDGGWFNSLKPTYGILGTRRNAAEPVSYCRFDSPIIEGPTNGIYLDYCSGCVFESGTSEDCTDGVVETSNASGNMFVDMDFEANSTADVSSAALQSVYQRCDSNTLLSLTGNDIKVDGGLHSQINIGFGALNTRLYDLRYNRNNNSSTISDPGAPTTATVKRGCINYATGAADGPASVFSISTTSPYTNNRVGQVGVQLQGGTITSVTLTRSGSTGTVYSGSSLNGGVFETSPGDVLTWSGTPTQVLGFPRYGF